jgi:virulence factor Mce-like protein
MKRIALATAVVLALCAWLLSATGSSDSSGVSGGGSYQVRALFTNAAFAVPGEQVRIAGAPVGTIGAVTVTKQYLAAVTLQIDNSDFVPFHANATCTIRPQSLIAERFVDCDPGTSAAPPLRLIARGPGAGSYLLPVAQTSSSLDPDIVQDISQEPIRERLAVILDELGTGLAGHGRELNQVILRANPALGATDQVLAILARQSHVLAALARDSDTVLAPLAGARRQLADFIAQANTTAVASAQQAANIQRGIRLLPGFLSSLRPLLADLGDLATQGTPVMNSLGRSAAAVNREFSTIVPFATSARTALLELGSAAQRSQASLVASEPLARRLLALGNAAGPTNAKLDELTASLQKTGAIQDLMSVLFYGTSASNGFDASGHYLRTDALVGSCTAYARVTVPGCSASFAAASASASNAIRSVVRQALARTATPQVGDLSGLMKLLVGGGA